MAIIKNPDNKQLKNIRSILNEGNLVVYPTDTIYGIAADITNPLAITKVYETKNRSYSKPMSICLHDINQVEKAVCVNDTVLSIIKKLLPGPYTLLVHKNDAISNLLTNNTDVVGIRIPDNRISHALTRDFPITSTSANISNYTTPDNVADIEKQLGNNISVYVDCGAVTGNNPSTIIDLTNKHPKLLRQSASYNGNLKSILNIDLFENTNE